MTSFTSRLIVASTVFAASMGSAASEESLNAVISNHWDWVLEQYPEYRREFGDMSGTQEWTDLSLDAIAKRNQDQASFIEELAQIDEDSLNPESRLNRRMLMTSLEEDQESYANGLHLIALNMRSGPQHLYTTVERLPMRTEQDTSIGWSDWKSCPRNSTSICHCSMPDSISNVCKHKSLSSVFRISSLS